MALDALVWENPPLTVGWGASGMAASSLNFTGMATLVAPLLTAAAPLALAGASPLTTSAAPLTTVLLSAVAADSSTVAPNRDAKHAFRRENTPAYESSGGERRAGAGLGRLHISRPAACRGGVENPETSTMLPPELPFVGAEMVVTAAATKATEMAMYAALAAGADRCLPRRLVR